MLIFLENIVFALDIGTRTVIGLVCKVTEDKIEVIGHHVKTHKDRAMKDGQIHNIEQVAFVVKEVKETLEKKTGLKLSKASIAAAGRALRTIKGSSIVDFSDVPMITNSHVQKVELEALLKCKHEINNMFPDEQLYCVGYSVLTKKINGYTLDNLEGRKGGITEVEIIATFLPNVVVDSLFEVLKRVDIAIESLTLEPIAAIEIAIPQKFRMLNLALVDIGAGTSDIAISRNGSIIGYGMVQKAGDKITEAVAEKYLIDFNLAEDVKVAISTKEKARFNDILGIKHELTKEQFLKDIEPVVDDIVSEITREILFLNGKAPGAIFCVGGGSQIDTIRLMLAQKLEMPVERVAIRSRESLENIKFKSKALKGPEVVTPLGIAAVAQKNTFHNFIKVYVNDEELTIFNAKKITVAQCLFSAGIKIEEVLKGSKAEDISYTIMGEEVKIPGSKGYPGELFLNESKVSLEAEVNQGDKIKVIMPKKPKNVGPIIKDILSQYTRGIVVNGKNTNLLVGIKVNGQEVNFDYTIKNGDVIDIQYISYLSDLLNNHQLSKFDIVVDGEKVNDDVLILNCREVTYKNKELANTLKVDDVYIAPLQEGSITVIANNQTIMLAKNKPIIVDVFDKLNINLTEIKGTLKIMKNGLEAGFADEVRENDIIKIYWD